MKNKVAYLTFILVDVVSIFFSILIAYFLRESFNGWIRNPIGDNVFAYVLDPLTYCIVILTFFHAKLYQSRYDFWEETKIVYKGLFKSILIIFFLIAITKSVEEYSRFIVLVSFFIMVLLIPLSKNMSKKALFFMGIWSRKAEVYGEYDYMAEELFGNPYLGYVRTNKNDAETIFIDTKNMTAEELEEKLALSLKERKEVLFTPLLQTYNLSNARIIELTNTRKNLIVVNNSLLINSNIIIKKLSDIIILLLIFPLLVILFLVIIIIMKKENPKGKIFFKQIRMGHHGKQFVCYKFRTMCENGDQVLKNYLNKHPDEIAYYNQYHKYHNDPRITIVGRFLRKTSLDEIPQFINVLKGEMSLIGPRPYMLSEKEKIGDNLEIIVSVKPGITGLWQVSGRSEVDFFSRVKIDVWYTRNWNLWLDLVIMAKTIKVVLFRDGAK